MIGAVGARARRWVALATAAAVLAHAFGMGLIGPKMAGTLASAASASLVLPPVPEECPSHSAAAEGGGNRYGQAAAAGSAHHGAGSADEDEAGHGDHTRSCSECPLGQTGMAFGAPPAQPIATSTVVIEGSARPACRLLVEAWPYRTPPARAPPPGAA